MLQEAGNLHTVLVARLPDFRIEAPGAFEFVTRKSPYCDVRVTDVNHEKHVTLSS